MTFNQKLIVGLFFGCVILNSFVDTSDKSNLNPSYTSVQSVVRLNGEGQNTSSESTPRIPVNRREMLRKHFPDWEERVDYQKKQEKIYWSVQARIAEGKRLGVKFKLTKQDALDYFNGENFYNYYQSLKTPPNIFDTRSSFLLKIEKNREIRENFLKAYNQRKSEN